MFTECLLVLHLYTTAAAIALFLYRHAPYPSVSLQLACVLSVARSASVHQCRHHRRPAFQLPRAFLTSAYFQLEL